MVFRFYMHLQSCLCLFILCFMSCRHDFFIKALCIALLLKINLPSLANCISLPLR